MKQRHELEFQVTYSILMEEMQMRLMRRCSNVLVFIQLALGISLVSNFIGKEIIAASVAFIAFIFKVWDPSGAAGKAETQRLRYVNLSKSMDMLSDVELNDRLHDLTGTDSEIIGSLTHPAWLAASRREGASLKISEK